MTWLRARLFFLPVWGWILLAAGVAAAIMLYRKRKNGNAGALSADTTATPVGVTPTTLSPMYNYYYNGGAVPSGNGQQHHTWDHNGTGTGGWTTDGPPSGGGNTPAPSDNTPATSAQPSVAQTTFAPAAGSTSLISTVGSLLNSVAGVVAPTDSSGRVNEQGIVPAPVVNYAPAPATTPAPVVIAQYTNPPPPSYSNPTAIHYSSGYGSGKQIA